ncbi:hypothetical protein K438DRAFT_1854692 [Mycena galopus ATCC 62051]|nr:hypothetical protein K438DRAFT_1854692 [Mycena galopus ATCC 62051]
MSRAKYSTPSAGRSPRALTPAAASTIWLTASSAGLVVGLDYKNPYLEPYRECQVRVLCSQCYLSYLSCLPLPSLPPFTANFCTNHYPHFRALLAGGNRLAYGAHALTDGRLQSSPRLNLRDGAVVEWVILTSRVLAPCV